MAAKDPSRERLRAKRYVVELRCDLAEEPGVIVTGVASILALPLARGERSSGSFRRRLC